MSLFLPVIETRFVMSSMLDAQASKSLLMLKIVLLIILLDHHLILD